MTGSLRIDGLTEQELILDRLKRFLKIHVGRPQGQQAVLKLKAERLVDFHWDEGIMVVYLPGARLAPLLPSGGGGEAA